MTLEVTVLDRWTFPVKDNLLPLPSGLPWFASWVQKDLHQASRHVGSTEPLPKSVEQEQSNG